jgi:hypothetical protein
MTLQRMLRQRYGPSISHRAVSRETRTQIRRSRGELRRKPN